jgi:hypothetical protein
MLFYPCVLYVTVFSGGIFSHISEAVIDMLVLLNPTRSAWWSINVSVPYSMGFS